jgi:hypothetical protein
MRTVLARDQKTIVEDLVDIHKIITMIGDVQSLFAIVPGTSCSLSINETYIIM